MPLKCVGSDEERLRINHSHKVSEVIPRPGITSRHGAVQGMWSVCKFAECVVGKLKQGQNALYWR